MSEVFRVYTVYSRSVIYCNMTYRICLDYLKFSFAIDGNYSSKKHTWNITSLFYLDYEFIQQSIFPINDLL